MTVCIAAACERATKVVVATDRALSYGGIVAETIPGKMIWIDDWLVLYAGTPASTALIIAALREIVKSKLTSGNVRQAFRAAYCRRRGLLSSFFPLSSYDMSLETFKKNGLKIFGESEFNRLSQEIAQASAAFNEQLLVIGWGKTPHAIMLYEVSPNGDWDHHFGGIAAIGSGNEVALSTMLLLGQSRSSSLAETLYTVAAAKFASEKSIGEDVGRKTSIYIGWKRIRTDVADKPPGKFLEEDKINELYALWNRYGKPRISDDIFLPVNQILQSIGVPNHPSTVEANALIRSAFEKSKMQQSVAENRRTNQADSAESKE
jgi:20S proteasome alpha/beta subunit